jgi:hypothetical protein
VRFHRPHTRRENNELPDTSTTDAFFAALQPPKQTEWLDKHQAAAALDMSTRSVLTMATEGRIQSKRQHNPRNKQVSVWLHAGDVERIRYERLQPRALQPVKPQAPHTPAAALPAPLQNALTVPLHRKLFLTEAEAVAYSGLGSAYLRQMVVGETKGPRGARVYRRRDLDAL